MNKSIKSGRRLQNSLANIKLTTQGSEMQFTGGKSNMDDHDSTEDEFESKQIRLIS